MSETDLTRSVREALEAMGVYVLRVQAGGYRGRTMGAPKGTPDLIGRFPWWHSRPGVMFAVETKASHGLKCNRKECGCPKQREWGVRLELDKGVYVTAMTVEQALAGLGLLRGAEWCG